MMWRGWARGAGRASSFKIRSSARAAAHRAGRDCGRGGAALLEAALPYGGGKGHLRVQKTDWRTSRRTAPIPPPSYTHVRIAR